MIHVEVDAADLTQVWRGMRGGVDAMSGRGGLILRAPGVTVEISGTPEELEALRARLNEALTAEAW